MPIKTRAREHLLLHPITRSLRKYLRLRIYTIKSIRIIYLFVAGVIIIPFTVFGITTWFGSQFQRLPVLGPEKHIVGDFSFKNQLNEEITQNNWADKIVVANYFFTS